MRLRVILAVLSSVPLVAFFATLAYAAYAWSVVGHWPYYAHPDPKELPATLPRTLVFASVVLALVSSGIFPAVAALSVAMGRLTIREWLSRNVWPVAAFLLGTLLWVGDWFGVGQRGLLSWLAD